MRRRRCRPVGTWVEIGSVSVESAAPEIVANGPWFAWHEDVFTLAPLTPST